MLWEQQREPLVLWEPVREVVEQPEQPEGPEGAVVLVAAHTEGIHHLSTLVFSYSSWLFDRTIALAVSSTVLAVLIEALLSSSILGIITLLIVLLLLVLGRVSSKLAGLERLSGRLERGDIRSEASLRLGGVLLVEVQLLLSLAGEVLILSGRIVLPRVEVGHGD